MSFPKDYKLQFIFCISTALVLMFNIIFHNTNMNNLFLIDMTTVDPGRDFYASLALSDKLYPYYGEAFPYPPIIVLFYYFLSHISDPTLYLKTQGINYVDAINKYYSQSMNVRICFYVITLIVLAAILLLVYKNVFDRCSLKNKFILVMLSICLLSNIGLIIGSVKGNSIVLALLFTLTFLLYYDDDDSRLRTVGLLGLSIAINIKPYTFIFSLLYLKAKKINSFAKLMLISSIFFFVPFLFLKGGFFNSLISFFVTLFSFGAENAPNMIGVKPFLHNLFRISTTILQAINFFYLGITIFAFLKASKKWVSILFLSLAMILFTYNYGYILCFLLPSLMFFLIEEKELNIFNIVVLILFMIVLAPYYILVDASVSYWIRSFICNSALIILSIIISIYRQEKFT